MLAKKYRLTRKEVSHIQRKGKKINLDMFSIKYLANKKEYARFAINIPVKTCKKATERNRLRRLIYQEIRKTGVDQHNDYLLSLYNLTAEDKIKDSIKTICQQLSKYPS